MPRLSASPARRALLGSLAISMVLAAGAAAASNITYNVNETVLNGSVTGQITTDGATGVLTGGDIVSWNLLLQGGGASYTLTNLNSVVLNYGTNGFFGPPSVDVTATATQLLFNYSGPDAGYFAFQTFPAYGGQHYWCNATHNQGFDCAPGESVVPVLYSDPTSQYDTGRSGNQVIGVAAVTGVPEAAAWLVILVGFTGMGAAIRSRRATTALG